MKNSNLTSSDVAELLICRGIDAVKVERLFEKLPPFVTEIRGRILILAVGKAAIPMTKACQKWLDRSSFSGPVQIDITVPHDYLDSTIGNCYAAGHPKPDSSSAAAGRRVMQLATELGSDDLLICLISGGGSALWAEAVAEISQQDLFDSFELFLRIGTDIHETNSIRSRLTTSAAGKLADAARPAKIISFAMSDVPGDHANVIASGPTSSPNSIAFLREVMAKYSLAEKLPDAVVSFLNSIVEDTAIWGEPSDTYHIIGSNAIATQALAEQSVEMGFADVLHFELHGNLREMAKEIASHAIEISLEKKVALIFGGETTVQVKGNGLGGRNQELALATMLSLESLNRPFLFATAGSDGVDGFSNAAGAWIDEKTLSKVKEMSVDPSDFLFRNDSHHFFKTIDQQIITGPTHTNVMDLAVLLLY